MSACSTDTWCAGVPIRRVRMCGFQHPDVFYFCMGHSSLLGDYQQAVALTFCGTKPRLMRQLEDGAIHCVSQGHFLLMVR